MPSNDVLEQKRPCQAIGCKRFATKQVLDTMGRKSYRCDTHCKPGRKAGGVKK